MKIKEITESGMMGQYKVVKTGPEGTTLQSPDMHTMLTLDPEAAKGIVANPANPNQFTLSQQVATGMTDQQGQQQGGIKQGATVEIPANENMSSGNYDFETTATNPAYIAWENGEGDEDNPPPETIDVGVTYSITGSYRPATWGYHGGEPEEHPDLEEWSVFNLETGEDISNSLTPDDVSQIESEIWQDAESSGDDDFDVPDDDYYDEDVGGDPTDKFIDDVRDKEFEKHNKSTEREISRISELAGIKTENFDETEGLRYEAIAALFGPEMWDNDDMFKFVQVLIDAEVSPRELRYIIQHNRLPQHLQHLEFPYNDNLQFGDEL